uniref:Cyclic nucleotide-binding domain-containing protein n=1 Tax=Zooxanthella nutricula TaxID=1333877 RepID=A0A7S2P502_9DINO
MPNWSQLFVLCNIAKLWRLFAPALDPRTQPKSMIEGWWWHALIVFASFFAFTHWCACILGVVAVLESGMVGIPTWADRDGSLGPTPRSCVDFYISSFYFAAYTVTSIGYGDLYPVSDFERVIDATIMIVSQLWVAKVFADFNILIAMHSQWRAQRHQRRTQTSVALKHMGVPLALRQRVIAYQDYVWDVHKGLRAQESIKDLSVSLKEEIRSILYHRLVATAPFLQHMSSQALRHILNSLTDCNHLPSEFIIRRGDAGAELYFLRDGRAGVFLSVNTPSWEDQEHKVVTRGDYFGEVALLTGQKRSSWVMARTYCVLSMLRKQVIDEVMEEDPSCIVKLATSMKQALKLEAVVTWERIAARIDRIFNNMEELVRFVRWCADSDDAGFDLTWGRYKALMQHLRVEALDIKLLWIDLDQEGRGVVSFRRFAKVAWRGGRDAEATDLIVTLQQSRDERSSVNAPPMLQALQAVGAGDNAKGMKRGRAAQWRVSGVTFPPLLVLGRRGGPATTWASATRPCLPPRPARTVSRRDCSRCSGR